MRRRRLNKRVVIILCVLLGLVLSMAAIAYIMRMPKDPKPFIDRGNEAFEAGDFLLATEQYTLAIKNDADDPSVYFRAAQAHLELVGDTELADASRREHYQSGRYRLSQALQIDAEFVEAQQLQTDLAWSDIVNSGRRGEQPNWDGYIAEASSLIEISPDSAATYFYRGQAYRSLMTRDEEVYGELARADFARAVELDPASLLFLVDGQIALLEQMGQIDEAQSAYEVAVEKNRDNPRLRVRLAALLYRREDKVGALEQIQAAIEVAQDKGPKDQIVGQMALADYYRWERQIDSALQAYETAETIDPTEFAAYVMHTVLLKQLGRYEESTEVMRKAMRAAEDVLATEDETELPPDQRVGLERAMLDLRYRLADSLMDEIARDPLMEEEIRATYIQEANDNLKIIDSQQDVRSIEPRYYKILGRIAMAERKIDDAMEHLTKAHEDTKATGRYDEHAARLLIELYRRDGQLDKAEQMIDEYLRAPALPNTVDVMLAKARLLMMYRDYDEAGRVVRDALEIRSDYAPARALQVRIAIEVDTLRPSQIPLDIELTPQQINAMILQASRIWVSGDQREAIHQMAELHRRAPENLNVARRLSQMYLIAKRNEDAEAILAAAIEAYPENEDLKFDLELLKSTPGRRDQMRLERAEQIEVPLDRALALANVTSISSEEDSAAQMIKTIKHLRAAAEINPQAANCLERMFGLCLRQKDWEQAQWAVEVAVRENLDRFDGQFYEARLAAAQYQFSTAIEQLEEILRERPQAKQPRLLLGRCYVQQGQYDQAANAFLMLYEADRSYAIATIEMMNLMILQGKMSEAEQWIKLAYHLAPYEPTVRNQYFRLQEALGSQVDIEVLISNRLQMYRTNPQDLQNRFWLARLYERADMLPRAEDLYRSIYNDSTDRIMGATVLMDYYNRVNQEAPVDAIISELLEEMEDKALVYILWGRFHGGRSIKRGLNLFDQAIREDPTDTRAYEAKAILLARDSRWEEAADAMATGLAVAKDAPEENEAMVFRLTMAVIRYRIEDNQFDVADRMVADLLAEYPDDIRAMSLAGVLAARRGDNERALEIFTNVLETSPEYIPVRVERAKLHIDAGEIGRARDDLEIANEAASDNNEVSMQLAFVYEQMHDRVSAQMAYERILDREPSYEPAIRRLIVIYFNSRDWTRLDGLLTDAKRRFVGEPMYYYFESDMWLQRGNVAKGLEALKAATIAAPNDQTAAGRYVLALVATDHYDEAMEMVDRYINDEGFGPWIKAIKARIYVHRGNTAEAEALFIEAVKEATRTSLSQVGLQMIGAYGVDEAINRLTDMASLRPDDWQMPAMIGDLCRDTGRFEESLGLLNTALRLTDDPEVLVDIYVSLGQTYYFLGDFVNSEAMYVRALDMNVGSVGIRAVAMNNLAYMYADDLDQVDKAEPYAKQAAELMPNDANIQDTYGWTLARLKRYEEAIRYLNRSISLERLPAALYHLGYVFEQIGRTSQANEYYAEVEQMLTDDTENPLYVQARAGLERLSALAPIEE